MISSRLRQCASMVGSGDALAKQSGIPRRTLETYMSGKVEPKASRILAICQAAGVNAHWLLSGEGPDKVIPDYFSDDHQMIMALRADPLPAPPSMEETVEDHAKISESMDDGISERAMSRHENYPFPVPAQWLKRQGLLGLPLTLIECRGDGMLPTIAEGALVAVDTSDRSLTREGLFMLMINDALTPRRIQIDLDKRICVRTDNPAYQDQTLSFEDAQQLAVHGAVVSITNRVY